MNETTGGFRFIDQIFPFVGNLDLVVTEILEFMDTDFRKRIGVRHVGPVERRPCIRENVFRAVREVGICVSIDTCAIDCRVFADGEEAPLEQCAAIDGPRLGRPIDPNRRTIVVTNALAGC